MITLPRIIANQRGAWNRWWRVKKTLAEKAMNSEHMLKGPVTLFDMTHPEDAADAMAVSASDLGGWRISDDEVIGGFSRGKARFIRKSSDYTQFMKGGDPKYEPDDGENVTSKEDVDSDFVPFLRWNGTTDINIGENSRAVRSGYCALRSPIFAFDGADLGKKYNALEVTCRSDGRIYTVNLKISSYFPDDLYQGMITVPATHSNKETVCQKTGGDFVTLVMPFQDFILTKAGRMVEVQRRLDGGVRLEYLGFTLMDGEDGDFEFDIARIRAINYYHGEILGETDDEAPY